MKKLFPILLIIPLIVGGFFSFNAPRASAAAPVTDPYFSNTVLLMHANGTNGSTTFTDQMSHPITVAGSAQISTTQSKFGGASASFNGTTDKISTPDSNDWNYGSGDFTIETWVYFNSLATTQVIVNQGTDATSNLPGVGLDWITGVGMYFYVHNGTAELVTLNPGTAGWAANTWYHVAVVRSGTTWTMYRNGAQIYQITGNSSVIPDVVGALYLGWRNYAATTEFLNGYLDDLRITKGVARYTANFTVPTAAFPNQGPTGECTGGVITRSGGYTIHTFLSSSTFTCPLKKSVDYLVVGGGGAGGGIGNGAQGYSGGGGAGGMLTGTLAVSSQAYSITVGAGGVGNTTAGVNGPNGSNSVFSTVTATGGGGGGGAEMSGSNGGSGGGSGGTATAPLIPGTGIAGQGHNGGNMFGQAGVGPAGGGGGAGAVGGDASSGVAGNGGAGLSSSISGSAVTYAGGGGGSVVSGTGTAGSGGAGGGGAGVSTAGVGVSGTANTGGGGGGSSGAFAGGNGGSGIVIIRYLTPAVDCTGGNVSYAAGRTIHTFLASGTLTCYSSKPVSYLVVAGGGASGNYPGSGYGSGGGGAGGLKTASGFAVSAQAYSVTVGAGGTGGAGAGGNGGDSIFSTITSTGGGGGGAGVFGAYDATTDGKSGGSGGGGGGVQSGSVPSAGTGAAGQGYNGGAGTANASGFSSGGGGSGGAAAGPADSDAAGGVGTVSTISGSSVTYATGGIGSASTANYVAGGANTGNGGAGGGGIGSSAAAGKNGGSGIVIVSYPTASIYASTAKIQSLGTKLVVKGTKLKVGPPTYRYLRLKVNSTADGTYSEITQLLFKRGSTTYPTVNLTSNSLPSPLVALASDENSSTYAAWHAFNTDTGDAGSWISSNLGGFPKWIQIDLGAGNGITPTGVVLATTGTSGNQNRMPATFSVLGSNTGLFAGEEHTFYTGSHTWTTDETLIITF